MDLHWVRQHISIPLRIGGLRQHLPLRERRFRMFAIIAAAVSAPLAQFAEGALLAASVYAASRGKARQ